jgi:gamma-glutamylcyclotransferase (GGCT)/AIG2-like uncharacterized protein YtfP
MHLFAYGTLTFPEVWERVVGKHFASEPATLDGFVVRRVVDDVYPVMISADDASRVCGLVYRDLDEAMLTHLDDYESDLYDRVAVTAKLSSGEAIECQAYVLPSRHLSHASESPWNSEEFAARQLASYMERLK